MPLMRCILAIALALLLAACGGGGGNAPPPATAFIVSGTLTSASNTAIDSDTNDPLAELIGNDAPATAQAIPNPVLLGGFATAVPTNSTGDTFADSADLVDAFRTTLGAGQTITLTIADHPGDTSTTPDLDLYLATTADPGTWVAQSISQTSRTETMVVPTTPGDGEYFIVVNAVEGQSNYLLNVQPATTVTTAPPPPDFVPGEIVLRLNEQALPLGVADPMAHFAAQTGLRMKAGGRGRPGLFTLPGDETERLQIMSTIGATAASSAWGVTADPEARLRHDTLTAIKTLRERADVRSADLNYIHQTTATPSDLYYGLQWHYPLIDLPQAWDVQTGTTTVITAVVDTGVYLAHPDLDDILVPGYDFISDADRANDGESSINSDIDSNPDDPGDGVLPGTSSFHGTHVAGTVAAETNNSAGVAGVSWGTRIMPIRVLGVGGGTTYDIVQGVRYAAGLSNDSGGVPASPADIINLSLGCSGCATQIEQELYTAIRNIGVIVIAAAGNSNTDTPFYPAAYNGVVSVSAVDYQKQRAPYSNFGSTIDVAAPGGNMAVDANSDSYPDGVLSTHVDESTGTRQASYSFLQGTSMAAPHMAGVVALMKSGNPTGVTPDTLDFWLQNGDITEDLGDAGRDDIYGHGLINAALAVQAAASGTVTLVTASPDTLDFGSALTELTLTLDKTGEGIISNMLVTENATWLEITPPPPPGSVDGLGDYTATADRSVLSDGIYKTAIDVTYTADGDNRSLSVPVTLTVGIDTTVPGDTGLTWVIMVDANDFTSVAGTALAGENGLYSYSIPNVPNGEYYVIAGTDSDNDNILCDAGEACGGYPTLGILQRVTVNGANVTAVDFDLSFPTELGLGALIAGMDAGQGFTLPTTQTIKEVQP